MALLCLVRPADMAAVSAPTAIVSPSGQWIGYRDSKKLMPPQFSHFICACGFFSSSNTPSKEEKQKELYPRPAPPKPSLPQHISPPTTNNLSLFSSTIISRTQHPTSHLPQLHPQTRPHPPHRHHPPPPPPPTPPQTPPPPLPQPPPPAPTSGAVTERALPLLKVKCPGPGERRSGIRGRADDRENIRLSGHHRRRWSRHGARNS